TTYPSGMIVSYVRNKANQIIQVNVNQGVSTKIYANNITYYPFGPLSRIEFLPPGSSGGNPGVTAPGGAEAGGGCIPQPGGGCSPPPPSNPVIQTRVYDLDYAVDSIGGLDYTVDVIGRISSIVDAAGGNTYEYDNMDRLTKVKDSDTLADAMAFTYDATGNRMSKKNGALALEAYTYDAGNHRLKTVAGQTRSYDANGNTIQTATNKRFTFDDRNRYVDYRTGNPTNSIQNQYQYNAKGDRVRKYKDAVDHARYTYGENGQILVIEKIAGGVTTTQEILWLDDMPIGVSQNGTLHGILTDHLMSPRSVFEISTQKTVWRWDMADDAFGENALNIAEDPDANGILFKFDMRFPGQIADAETGFNYNYFRDFEPTTGRYIQSDPIGLKGGLSTYAYVTSKPLQYVDRHGLSPTIPCDGGNGVTLCDGKGGFETFNCNRDKCTRACTQMHENQHKLDFQLLMPNACQGIPRGRDPETALLPKKPGTNEDFYDYSNWMECRGAAAALNCAQNKCDCDTSRYKQKQINVLIGKNCAQYGISPESAEKYQW
ncbi:MAG: RHS repeat domain-containing protein, partial [Arenimonas sp.]